ncbi:MAG: DUF4194 domain-containing protein [Halanaerobiales bacterium]|nr:DUF4194 domain-containing protein [Halanaerobiales bacterium]
MWFEQYRRMTVKDKEDFTQLVNQLLASTYLLRESLDRSEKRLKINRDYSFVERHFEIFRDYLKIAGWLLKKDNAYGVIFIENSFGLNRTRLNKNETLILYTLRLIYEEESEKLSLKRESIITVGDLINKMISIGLISKKLADVEIHNILSLLKRYNIIDKIEGRWADPETRIIIYSSILFIVTNEKISAIFEMMQDKSPDEEAELDEAIEEDAFA